MSPASWFDVMFDNGDGVCNGETARETQVGIYLEGETDENLVSLKGPFLVINPLNPFEDAEGKVETGRRADANVTKFRTILVEFDKMPVHEQLPFVKEGIKMPFSLATFSGSKSVHFLICLETPLAARREYDQLVARVYKAVGGKEAGLDESTKNPSRFTRTPNALRAENGETQSLIENNGRVANAALEEWLLSRGVGPEYGAKAPMRSKLKIPGAPNWKAPMSTSTQLFLSFGAEDGTWNTTCFKAACDMYRCGYTEDEIIVKMEGAFGYLDHSAINTVKSAVKRAEMDID